MPSSLQAPYQKIPSWRWKWEPTKGKKTAPQPQGSRLGMTRAILIWAIQHEGQRTKMCLQTNCPKMRILECCVNSSFHLQLFEHMLKLMHYYHETAGTEANTSRLMHRCTFKLTFDARIVGRLVWKQLRARVPSNDFLLYVSSSTKLPVCCYWQRRKKSFGWRQVRDDVTLLTAKPGSPGSVFSQRLLGIFSRAFYCFFSIVILFSNYMY